ncbi:MAG TPA: hypothetical protein VKT49_25720 [Bryobacteraceae bacterium]|nr:hypothetical protein [Bryobacteraceae bacterium]
MFHYSAYNLAIASEIRLPELPLGPPGDDLQLRLAAAEGPVEPQPIQWREPVGEAFFSFPRVGRFLVRAGREVIITPDPDSDPTLFPLYVQGMMLASALYQRGLFVLHASVIDFDGSAVALMGPIGAGKSTFASAFHARGHRLLADDNAALASDHGVLQVLPAFPSLKVYPEVARSLGHRSLTLKPMHHSQIKQAQSVAHAFSRTPRPLQAIYVLDREAPPAISGLTPIESITELIRHSVPTRWAVKGSPCHLKMCASMAQRIPMFRVRTFQDIAEIGPIAAQIERHLAPQLNSLGDRQCRIA